MFLLSVELRITLSGAQCYLVPEDEVVLREHRLCALNAQKGACPSVSSLQGAAHLNGEARVTLRGRVLQFDASMRVLRAFEISQGKRTRIPIHVERPPIQSV